MKASNLDQLSASPLSYKQLDLSDQHLTFNDCVRLKYILKFSNSSAIETASFANCTIGNAGTLLITNALSSLNHLRFIDLSGNGIDDTYAPQLMTEIKKINSIYINLDNNLITSIGASKVISELSNSNNNQARNYKLSLKGNKIGSDGMEVFASILMGASSLDSIFLDDNHIGDLGMTELSKWPNSGKLKLLSLNNNQITSEGVDPIIKLLKGYISGDQQNIIINLDGNQIGDEGMKLLIQNKISVGYPIEGTRCYSFTLNNNQIGDLGITALAEEITSSQSPFQRMNLGLVSLENNMIGDLGAIALADVLKNHRGLPQPIVNLDNNHITPDTIIKMKKQLHNIGNLSINYQNSEGLKDSKDLLNNEENTNDDLIKTHIDSISKNPNSEELYEKLGSLFLEQGEYRKAIDCYRVVNNSFEVKACFKEWLANDPKNYKIVTQMAEYYASIGLLSSAEKYCHFAVGLVKDPTLKAEILDKVNNVIELNKPQVNFFNKLGQIIENNNLCNFEAVNEEFIQALIGNLEEESSI